MRTLARRVVFLVALLSLAAAARAGIVAALSPAEVAYGLSIDWSLVGSDGDFIPQPFAVPMSAQISATVSLPSDTDLMRVDEGTSWLGDFAPGTALLWTNWDPGPLQFVFNAPIRAFGADFQPDFAGGDPPPSFSVTMEAFGTGGISLGSVSADGYSTMNEDGSALFLGFISSTVDVSSVEISVFDELGNASDFTIDGPVGGGETVPEPGAGWLAAPALGFLLLRHCRRASGRSASSSVTCDT